MDIGGIPTIPLPSAVRARRTTAYHRHDCYIMDATAPRNQRHFLRRDYSTPAYSPPTTYSHASSSVTRLHHDQRDDATRRMTNISTRVARRLLPAL